MKKPIVFSGIQPTGNLHIGNYLGAVKHWVELQNSGTYDCYFCIVDYHSLTGNMDADTRREQITRIAAELLACGIDLEKSTLFVQSHVPEHTELGWIFNTVTPVAELERMTQFKDKSGVQKQNVNAGLFTYPILQAADILLYHGQFVPVGLDQVQHVELTRDIARWFNKKYPASSAGRSNYFPEAKPLLTKIPKVMSLLEPEKKMSKSLGEGHVIELADEPAVIAKKIKKAVTATMGGAHAPGVENLLLLLREFGEKKVADKFVAMEKNKTIQYGDLKEAVSHSVGEYFADFRARREDLLEHPEMIAEQLAAGAERAGAVAKKTMADVRARVGIR